MAGLSAAREVLKRYFGYDDFRPGQVDVVASVVEGCDTLGVLPTGGGKSLCYQVPALARPGLTVVISPLISLMKDQVDRLERLRVPATFLNSTLGAAENSARLARARAGELKLLYVAPERFAAADLQRCLARSGVALLAVDEAHCISEWGHEFRPSFRRIAAVARDIGVAQTMAVTATATPAVRRDIVAQLRLRAARVIVAGFDRVNLRYAVHECRNDDAKRERLILTLRSHARPAIVYASTRSAVERIAKIVLRSGLRARPYHGGLDADHRRAVQDAFMGGSVDCLVATNAFGMGIDKPDVRLVVHYTMPGTLEAYYQEAGRAGRDGKPGDCVLLHAFKDRFTHEWFIDGMFPDRAAVERVFRTLRSRQEGGSLAPPPGRDVERAIGLLEQYGLLVRHPPNAACARVRLLATPARITRELGSTRSGELDLLRELWRRSGARLQDGVVVDLDALGPGIGRRAARVTLERLRDRQFVHVTDVGGGLHLARTDATGDMDRIPWSLLQRRAAAERAKLDTMQAYTYTRTCRRAFVLRYFGEGGARTRCDGCDNCLRA
jgi:ATP-dependent DNA helicase RecQ